MAGTMNDDTTMQTQHCTHTLQSNDFKKTKLLHELLKLTELVFFVKVVLIEVIIGVLYVLAMTVTVKTKAAVITWRKKDTWGVRE